jgi:hypothetical protein
MPSLRSWIEKIERRMSDPASLDEDKEREWVISCEILNEIGALQGNKATHYRGGTPPTPIQATDPTGDALGYPYTWGDLVTLAIRRVFERNSDPSGSSAEESSAETAWDLEGLVLERSINLWTEAFKDMFGEDGWDRVEAEGPPEPPRPWR